MYLKFDHLYKFHQITKNHSNTTILKSTKICEI